MCLPQIKFLARPPPSPALQAVVLCAPSLPPLLLVVRSPQKAIPAAAGKRLFVARTGPDAVALCARLEAELRAGPAVLALDSEHNKSGTTSGLLCVLQASTVHSDVIFGESQPRALLQPASTASRGPAYFVSSSPRAKPGIDACPMPAFAWPRPQTSARRMCGWR